MRCTACNRLIKHTHNRIVHDLETDKYSTIPEDLCGVCLGAIYTPDTDYDDSNPVDIDSIPTGGDDSG